MVHVRMLNKVGGDLHTRGQSQMEEGSSGGSSDGYLSANDWIEDERKETWRKIEEQNKWREEQLRWREEQERWRREE